MSLIKQLWIAILAVMLFAFGGSLIVSILSARHYLEQQLHIKNIDNATSLALSLSQMPKDPVTVELQIAAQFDAGHYRLIRLTAPDGVLIIEREYLDPVIDAPRWFARLFPMTIAPGFAQVQDGWRQYGTLTVESHSDYAYAALWKETLMLLAWFLLGAVISGFIGTLLLKRILRPLDQVVDQAKALGERRFITIAEPCTREFRTVVRAMNTLSERMRSIFEHESQRLEALRRQSQYDPTTGLLNREQFSKLLDTTLSREDANPDGTLLVGRIGNLKHLNQQMGHQVVDELLSDIGQIFKTLTEAHDLWDSARLDGADFALLAVGEENPDTLAVQMRQSMEQILQRWQKEKAHAFTFVIGGSTYHLHENHRHLMIRIHNALALAEQEQDVPFVIVSDESLQTHHSGEEWKALIAASLTDPGIRLQPYPVVSSNGALIHMEAPARLMFDKQWHNAGYFMRGAAQTGLVTRLDLSAISAALHHIEADGVPIAIHVSPQSLCDLEFRNELVSRLQQHPILTPRLWLEVPETGVLKGMAEFRSLCLSLKPLGCRLGLEHVGWQFSQIKNLQELGLDYIKIDAALIRDIDRDDGNQSFLRGLCVVAHAIGLLVIAEGINSEEERGTVIALGVDGLTGPAITAWHQETPLSGKT